MNESHSEYSKEREKWGGGLDGDVIDHILVNSESKFPIRFIADHYFRNVSVAPQSFQKQYDGYHFPFRSLPAWVEFVTTPYTPWSR